MQILNVRYVLYKLPWQIHLLLIEPFIFHWKMKFSATYCYHVAIIVYSRGEYLSQRPLCEVPVCPLVKIAGMGRLNQIIESVLKFSGMKF